MNRTPSRVAVVTVVGLVVAGIAASAARQSGVLGVTQLVATSSVVVPGGLPRSIETPPDIDDLILWEAGTLSSLLNSQAPKSRTELAVTNGPNAVARARRQRTIFASRNRVTLVNSTGSRMRSFPIPISESIAALPTGDFAVASATVDGLVHVFSPLGAQRGHFGAMKAFDAEQPMNQFLNQGLVFSGPDSDILYVSANAPDPTVQRFGSDGRLLAEFPLGGRSLDAHTADQKTFLVTREAGLVGGYKPISSATFGRLRGTIFVATTARQQGWESIYEYTLDGTKIAEYDLQLQSGEQLTRLTDIAVRSNSLTVLTDSGVHTFTLPTASAFDQKRRIVGLRIATMADKLSFVTTAWARQTCAPYISAGSCESDYPCSAGPSGKQDCVANAANQMNLQRLISKTCTNSAYSCTFGGTTCFEGTNQVHANFTLSCPTDVDGDGYSPDDASDCHDGDPDINPGESIGECGPYSTGDDYNCNGIGDSEECLTPIVVDVLGNGFDLTNKAGGVTFDLLGTGKPLQLPWTSTRSDDSWLAMDRNGNGVIDNGKELWGAPTDQPPSHSRNGYIALAEFDRPSNGGNDDESIDRNDLIFSKLLLWKDVNHDGVSQRMELSPLGGTNIRSIDLNYREYEDRDQYGNWFRYKSPANAGAARIMVRTTCDVYLWAK